MDIHETKTANLTTIQQQRKVRTKYWPKLELHKCVTTYKVHPHLQSKRPVKVGSAWRTAVLLVSATNVHAVRWV